VKVAIGGADATVQYTASAGDTMPGALQVNALIPLGIASGDCVPIVLTIGRTRSQDGVTLAVK
jgi:uncharacterized protein (TIGR03437 family)